jgi:hypothetical protein
MLIHAPLKTLLQGQIPYCSTGMSFVPCLANVLFRLKKNIVLKQEKHFMNNENN